MSERSTHTGSEDPMPQEKIVAHDGPEEPTEDPTPEAETQATGSELPEWLVKAHETEQDEQFADFESQAPPPEAAAEAGPESGQPKGPELEGETPAGADAPTAPMDPIDFVDYAHGESSAEGAQDLAAELDRHRREAEQFREKWMRSMAELENFRKRSRREIENSINFANANLLRDLLDVLDNFERAHGALDEGQKEAGDAYIEGMRLIYQRFVEILRQNGLERIPAKGVLFDPNLHEAVSQIETDEAESGHVAQVVQEGYLLKEQVLRPSKVIVAK